MPNNRALEPRVTIEILLVEDSPGDAFLVQEAFREARVRNIIHVAEDGVEALAFLKKLGKYTNAPTPDLILLDLNLPKKSGREVLAEIRADGSIKHIPVVVMTISQAEEDIFRSYQLHANCYITKPVDLHQFLGIIKKTEDYWLTVVKLPKGRR